MFKKQILPDPGVLIQQDWSRVRNLSLKSAFSDSVVRLVGKYWRVKQERGATRIDGGFPSLIVWGQAHTPPEAYSLSRPGQCSPTPKVGGFSLSSARGTCTKARLASMEVQKWPRSFQVRNEVPVIFFQRKDHLQPHSKPRNGIFLISVFLVSGTSIWHVVGAQCTLGHAGWWVC